MIAKGSKENSEFCEKILKLLNNSSELKQNIKYTPRVIGDTVQEIILNKIDSFGYTKTNTQLTKRSMADVELQYKDITLVIDIKTHSLEDGFHMPNLTSTTRLFKLLKDSKKYFMLLFVDYKIVDKKPIFTNVWFAPIENLAWDCLGIGALGNGQIQIKDANKISFTEVYDRELWCKDFRKHMNEYIQKQYSKLNELAKLFSE